MWRTEGNLRFLHVIPPHCLLDFVCLFYVFYEVDSLAGLELGNSLVWLAIEPQWLDSVLFSVPGLQMCVFFSDCPVMWILGIELRALCLNGKPFAWVVFPTLSIHTLMPLFFFKNQQNVLYSSFYHTVAKIISWAVE